MLFCVVIVDRGPLDVCFSSDFSKSVRKSVKGLKTWLAKKPVVRWREGGRERVGRGRRQRIERKF